MKPPPSLRRVQIHRRSDPGPQGTTELAELLRRHGRSIPMLAVTIGALRAAPLDARSGFLVSLLDGITNLESLLDVCGMPGQEALGLLVRLRERRFVTFVPPLTKRKMTASIAPPGC